MSVYVTAHWIHFFSFLEDLLASISSGTSLLLQDFSKRIDEKFQPGHQHALSVPQAIHLAMKMKFIQRTKTISDHVPIDFRVHFCPLACSSQTLFWSTLCLRYLNQDRNKDPLYFLC